jgi:phosphatidylglycerophosphatase C
MKISHEVSDKIEHNRPVIAIFDFDGTLTHKDSFLPFLQWIYGKFYWLHLIPYTLILIGYLFNLISNHRIKEILLSHFLKNYTEEEIKFLAHDYALLAIPELINHQALERLVWHQQQGHQIIIVSANLKLFITPWAKSLGVEQVIATELLFDNGLFTGKIQGRCCYGAEKVTQLRQVLGDLEDYDLHVYGDSQGDQEMLEIATYPYYQTFSNGKKLLIK